MPSLTLDIKVGSELHNRIRTGVRDRVNYSKRKFQNRREKWIKAEEAALAYLPEREVDAARRGVRDVSGKPQYTTLVLPYSYGVLMAAHTYWSTVFLSRAPILQYAGRHGESAQQVQAVEALMDYQMQVGEMLVPLYIWLYDVGKYGQGCIGHYWTEEKHTVSRIEEVADKYLGVIPTGKTRKRKIAEIVTGYQGNRIYNIRPADFLPDPRVTVANFQKGEFVAAYFELGWNTVLRRRDAGFYTNIDELRKRGTQGGNFAGTGQREAGSSQLDLPASEDITSEFGAKKSDDLLKGYECHIEIIPEQWKIGKGKSPEKWVFTTTSDFELVLGAQPLGAWHNKFPFNVIELEPEGYGLGSRGLPEIVEPVQRTMDWLINSHFYNVRKTLNNQWLVDPSRVVMKDVLDPMPGGIIRAKPAAYGTDMRTAIHQLDVTDVTRSHFTDMAVMNEVGQRATGMSDQILGVQQKTGGRKTAQEVRTSATFGVNRLKTNSEYMSAMGFTPMSQVLIQNSQQYYDGEKKFKLVGDLAKEAGAAFIDVNPEAIQGAYDFVPIDGTLPVDRFAQANLWRELLAQMRNYPQVMERYDIARIFAWVAQIAGLKNIEQFRIDVQSDDAVARAAQAGNIVPIASGGGGGSAQRDLDVVPEPGQISGLGTT